MRLGSMQQRKECDSERVGCAEAMQSGSSDDICLSFVDMGSLRKRKGSYVGEKGQVSRSLEGWEDDLWFIYTPAFTVS